MHERARLMRNGKRDINEKQDHEIWVSKVGK
jgi:hypothetical protein